MKLILLLNVLLATALTQTARADDDDDDAPIAASDVLLERDFAASAKVNALHVLIHKAGHLDDKPFVVEVTEFCPARSSVKDEPRVIDVESACDVAPSTLDFNPRLSQLSVLVREPNADGVCESKPKRVLFELASACAE